MRAGSFPIMNLPAELRREILLQTLGGNIYPNARTKQGMSGLEVTLGSKFQNCPISLGPKDRPVPRPDPPNYTILRVDKQIHDEAQKAAWQGTTKHFTSPLMMEQVIQAPNSPSEYRWLTHIQLCMNTNECFIFFGIDIDPVLRLLPQPSKGRMLQGITSLKSFEIVFGTPYKIFASAWHSIGLANGLSLEQYPCHKIMVEWVLIFAFLYLKHIPKVRLSGCIKTCTKTKWEHILSTEYLLRKENFKTHGYDPAMEAYQLLKERRPVYQ
jgi:hypothetical protein